MKTFFVVGRHKGSATPDTSSLPNETQERRSNRTASFKKVAFAYLSSLVGYWIINWIPFCHTKENVLSFRIKCFWIILTFFLWYRSYIFPNWLRIDHMWMCISYFTVYCLQCALETSQKWWQGNAKCKSVFHLSAETVQEAESPAADHIPASTCRHCQWVESTPEVVVCQGTQGYACHCPCQFTRLALST